MIEFVLDRNNVPYEKETQQLSEMKIVNYLNLTNGLQDDFNGNPAEVIVYKNKNKGSIYRNFRNGYETKRVEIKKQDGDDIRIFQNFDKKVDGPNVVIYKNEEIWFEKDFQINGEIVTEEEYHILKLEKQMEQEIPITTVKTKPIKF